MIAMNSRPQCIPSQGEDVLDVVLAEPELLPVISPVRECPARPRGQTRRRLSGGALTSVTLSVLSFVSWVVVGIPAPLLGLLGVIFGVCTCIDLRRREASTTGKWLARAGIWLGVLNLVFVFLGVMSLLPNRINVMDFG